MRCTILSYCNSCVQHATSTLWHVESVKVAKPNMCSWRYMCIPWICTQVSPMYHCLCRHSECSGLGLQFIACHISFRSSPRSCLCQGRGHSVAGRAHPPVALPFLWQKCCFSLEGDFANSRLSGMIFGHVQANMAFFCNVTMGSLKACRGW